MTVSFTSETATSRREPVAVRSAWPVARLLLVAAALSFVAALALIAVLDRVLATPRTPAARADVSTVASTQAQRDPTNPSDARAEDVERTPTIDDPMGSY